MQERQVREHLADIILVQQVGHGDGIGWMGCSKALEHEHVK